MRSWGWKLHFGAVGFMLLGRIALLPIPTGKIDGGPRRLKTTMRPSCTGYDLGKPHHQIAVFCVRGVRKVF